MPIAELFGYFSSLLFNGTRIMFVSNEEELSQEQMKDYNRYKEKMVGESYEVFPEYDKVIENFWNGTNLPKDENFIRFLTKACNIVGNKNLRSVNQMIYQWCIIYNGIESAYKKSDVIIDFFKVYVILKLQYNIKPDIYDYSGSDKDVFEKRVYFREKCHEAWMAFKSHKMSLIEYEQKLNLKNDELMKSRTTDLIIYHLMLPDIWYELLTSSKEFDARWMNEQIKILYEKKQKQNDLKEKFDTKLAQLESIVFSTTEEQVDDIQEMFENLCNDFQEGRYDTFGECIRFVKLYLRLLCDDILPSDKYSIEYLEEQIYKYVDKYGANVHFDGDTLPDIANLPQIERLQKIRVAINQLYELAELNFRKEREAVFQDRERFFALIKNPVNALGRYLDIPILKQIDIDSLFEWIKNENNNDLHYELLKFLQYRYGYGIDNTTLSNVGYADYESVQRIKNKYEECYLDTRNRFLLSVRHYKYFKEQYENLLSYMDEEHKKIKSILK